MKYVQIGTVCMGDRKIETYKMTNITLLCFWNGTWIVTQYLWNTLIHGKIKDQLDATDWFLLQNLLSAQHVSDTIMPIIRSSKFIQIFAACGTWRFGLQVSWSGVELWVMCPGCGMFLHNRTTTCKPKRHVTQAATICINFELLMMGIMVPPKHVERTISFAIKPFCCIQLVFYFSTY